MVVLAPINVMYRQQARVAALAANLAAILVAFLDGGLEGFIKPFGVREHRTTTLPGRIVRAFQLGLQNALPFVTAFAAAKYVRLLDCRRSPNWFATRLTRVPLAGNHLRMWATLPQRLAFFATKAVGILGKLRGLTSESLAAMSALSNATLATIPMAQQVSGAQFGKTLRVTGVFALLGQAFLEHHLCTTYGADNRRQSAFELRSAFVATEMMLVGQQAAGRTINRCVTVSA